MIIGCHYHPSFQQIAFSMLRFLMVEASQVTVRSLPEWRSKYFHLMMRRGRKTPISSVGFCCCSSTKYWRTVWFTCAASANCSRGIRLPLLALASTKLPSTDRLSRARVRLQTACHDLLKQLLEQLRLLEPSVPILRERCFLMLCRARSGFIPPRESGRLCGYRSLMDLAARTGRPFGSGRN